MTALSTLADDPNPDPVAADRLLDRAITASAAGRGADVADYVTHVRAVYPLPPDVAGGQHLQAAHTHDATTPQFRYHCKRAREAIGDLVTIMENSQ